MRTKTAILAAAAIAAGALASQAQNVYSLNVVGYINLPIPHGYSLLANQLTGTDNKVQTVLGVNFTSGTQVISWNAATQGFGTGDTFYDINATGGAPAGWYDSSFNPSTTLLNPGTAFFILNPGPATNATVVGQVTQGANTAQISTGYSFLSTIPPLAVDLATNGPLALPPINSAQVLTFNNAANSYVGVATYYDINSTGGAPAGWYDSAFNPAQIIPAVGQGFVLLSPSAANWVQTFSVQ